MKLKNNMLLWALICLCSVLLLIACDKGQDKPAETEKRPSETDPFEDWMWDTGVLEEDDPSGETQWIPGVGWGPAETDGEQESASEPSETIDAEDCYYIQQTALNTFVASAVRVYHSVNPDAVCRLSFDSDEGTEAYDGYVPRMEFYMYDYDPEEYDRYGDYLESQGFDLQSRSQDDGTVDVYVNESTDVTVLLYIDSDKKSLIISVYRVGDSGETEPETVPAPETAEDTIPDRPEPPIVDMTNMTIPAFNEIAAAQPDKGAATAEKYIVSGTITEITNTRYGNMYIEDAKGNRLYLYGVYSADGKVRYDAMNPRPEVGDTITVVGVACNYNGPRMKNGWITELIFGEILTEAETAPETIPDRPETETVPDEEPAESEAATEIIAHLSFDELRKNGDGKQGVFTPGQPNIWDGRAVIDNTVTFLDYWGWIAVYGEIGTFGYQIDDKPPVYDKNFAVTPEPGVVDCSIAIGADDSSRIFIRIDVSALEGNHLVRTLYRNPDGNVVILNEIDLYRSVSADPADPI